MLSYCGCVLGVTERSHTEEEVADRILEDLLAVSGTPLVSTQAVTGGFQAMPPLSTTTVLSSPSNTSTPDIVRMLGPRPNASVPSVFTRPEVTPIPAPLPTPLSSTTPLPPPVCQLFAPPTMPAPLPAMPDINPSPLSGLGLVPSSTSTPASQMPTSFPDITLPQYSSGSQTWGDPVFGGNVPSAAMYTPANQVVPMTTPQAPRMDRYQPAQNTRRSVLHITQLSHNFLEWYFVKTF